MTFPFPTFCPVAGASLKYLGAKYSLTGSSSYVFGGLPTIGSGLLVVAAVGRNDSATRNITSILVDGSAADIHAVSSGTRVPVAIASRRITAQPAEITVNTNSSLNRIAIGMWLLNNISSDTPSDADDMSYSDTGTNAALSINVMPKGFAIFAGIHANVASSSWSSATMRDDILDTNTFAFGDITLPVGASPHNETLSWSGSAARGIVGASWS